MVTILAIAAAIIVIGVATLVLLAARRPDTFSYARSIEIAAPPERIFPLIADPVAFNTWNPFNEDPGIKGTYSGPSHGPGARYTFESRKAGTGYTEIIDDHPPRLLVVRLVMTRPMACDNRVEFRLEPVMDGTRVTWAMSGPATFASKLMGQVIDCERMCGDQFTRGLTKLKSLVEREAIAA